MARIRIGDLLQKAGLIDEMQLSAGLAHQRQWGGKLGDALVAMGFLDEMMLWRGLSKQLGVPLGNLAEYSFPAGIERVVPADLCRKHSLVPMARDERLLTAATSEPNNIGGVDEVAFRAGCRLRMVLAPDREIEWAIRRLYQGEFVPCPPPRVRRVVAEPEPAVNTHAPGPVFDASSLSAAAQTPLNEIAMARNGQVGLPPAPSPASFPPGTFAPGTFSPVPVGQPPPTTAPPNVAYTVGRAPTASPFAVATSPGAYGAPAAAAPSLGVPPPGYAAAPVAAPPVPPAPSVEATLRETGQVLRAVVEVCIQRGLFTREEFLARVRAQP
jgi:type IV pilus assembly protein PilB